MKDDFQETVSLQSCLIVMSQSSVSHHCVIDQVTVTFPQTQSQYISCRLGKGRFGGVLSVVLRAISIMITVFWDVTPCELVSIVL
jgi:hypothetical protein